MVRRSHSRTFSRSVRAPPHCVAAANTLVAATPIVACGQNTHERPRSFRKGIVDVFVPSEARVSKKKQKQRERRRKHAQYAQQAQDDRQQTADNDVPVSTYGTSVNAASPRPACAQPLRPPSKVQQGPTALTEVCLGDENDGTHDELDNEYEILCAADSLEGPLVHSPADEAQCVIC